MVRVINLLKLFCIRVILLVSIIDNVFLYHIRDISGFIPQI